MKHMPVDIIPIGKQLPGIGTGIEIVNNIFDVVREKNIEDAKTERLEIEAEVYMEKERENTKRFMEGIKLEEHKVDNSHKEIMEKQGNDHKEIMEEEGNYHKEIMDKQEKDYSQAMEEIRNRGKKLEVLLKQFEKTGDIEILKYL